MKDITYIWSEIVRGNCRMKGEVPTLSHFLFWYILLINGTMKEIKLPHGKVTLVDDDDYEYLNQWKWWFVIIKNKYYVIRNKMINGKRYYIYLHRIIMDVMSKSDVDHIDGNPLNNQRNNLRICTHQQNCLNNRGCGKSRYKGVYKIKNTIYSRIQYNGIDRYLGSFKTEEEAAMAYDKEALVLFGEFANLNFK